jgi:hypothetical protein
VFKIGGQTTEETRLLWRVAGIGFQFGTEIIAGVLIGWAVDAYFGTRPWGIMVGAAAGIAVGIVTFIRGAIRINREIGKTPKERLWKPTEEVEEGDLTHEQWKAVRDVELDRDFRDERERDGSREN